jgi:hypothetical protein
MEGAFAAMWTGRVGRNCAREHHSLWAQTSSNQQGAARAGRPAATFIAGTAVAVLLAVAMIGIYQANYISTNARATMTGSAVHLTETTHSR